MPLSAPTNKLTAQAVQDSFDQLLYLDNATGMTSNTLKLVSTENSKSCLSISENHMLIKGLDQNNAALLQVSRPTDSLSMLLVNASSKLISTGTNGTGVDIYFYGDTIGNYVHWDESVDTLVMTGAAKLEFNAQGSGESIVGNGTDLTIASGNDINLTATANVNIPQNIGLTFGDDSEKISGDGTDLIIAANTSINLDTPQIDLIQDTNFVTSGGINGFSIDGTTFSVNGADNRVGIGTASPGAILEVAGTTSWLNSGSNAFMVIDKVNTASRSGLCFVTSGTSTESTPSTNIDWCVGTTDTDEHSTGEDFFIGTSTDSTTAKFFIDKTNGNVGIGTTSPAAKLHLATSDSTQSYLLFTNSTTNHTGGDGATFGIDSNEAIIINQRESNNIQMYTNNTERIRIDSSGKIGIGETDPQFQLDVQSSNTGKGQLRIVETATDNNCGIQMWASNGAAADDGWKLAATHSGSGLHFQSSKTAGMGGSYAWDTCLTLKPGSKAGVGTPSPGTWTAYAGASASYLDIYNGSYASVLSLVGNENADGNAVGLIQFVNNENATSDSNSSTGMAVASIHGEISSTSDNVSNNSGGELVFKTKKVNETVATAMTIFHDGRIGIGNQTDVMSYLEIDTASIDDEALSFHATGDVAHGITDLAHTECYGKFQKLDNDAGGLHMEAYIDASTAPDSNQCMLISSCIGQSAGAPSAGTTTFGGVRVRTMQKSGSTGGAVDAGTPLFSVSNLDENKFIVMGDGDMFAQGGTSTTNMVTKYDEYTDAHLVRAFDISSKDNGLGFVDSEFDKFVQYNHEKLAELNLVGREKDGTPNHFVNVTGMQRLHNGAIWQQYTEMQKMKELMYDAMVELMGKEKADKKLNSHDIKLLDNNILSEKN